MKAVDFNAHEIGAVITLLDAAQQLLDLDSMVDPCKFTLSINSPAVPAAEYAMRLWASSRGHSIDEWRSGSDGSRTLALHDRQRRMLVTLHGAAPAFASAACVAAPPLVDDDLHHDDDRGQVH